ncbi:MAG: hypothetical protein ACJAUY_000673 [Cognaticolwellia sp.]|jgi:hypothetical protein
MDFPSGIGFLISEPMSEAPSYLNESQSLKTLAVSTGAQRWGFSLTTGELKGAELRRAWAFINALSGSSKKFSIALPDFSEPLGVVTGQVQSPIFYAAGQNSISFTNYLPEIGDFLKFAGHAKVYQISDTAGTSATIFPNLIANVSTAEVVTVNNVKFTVRSSSDVSTIKNESTKTTKIKIKLIEAF